MRRVFWVAAIAVAAMHASTQVAAQSPSDHASMTVPAGTVTAVRLERATGRASVVIGVTGDVEISDYSLSAPHRIVVDVKGATLKMVAKQYDGVVRAGIMNIRIAQTSANVVRVVLDVDKERDYEVTRADESIRVSLDSPESFEPWNAPASASAPTAAVAAPAVERVVPPPAAAPVAPPKAAAVAAVAAPTLQQAGTRITVTFADNDLRDVLAVFAEHSGRSIVSAVPGIKVTAEIRDQPWQSALKAILDANSLAAVEDPVTGIITVATYQSLSAKLAAEPVVSRKVMLNYAKADVLAPIIQQLLSSNCASSSLQVVGGAQQQGVASSGINEAGPPMGANAGAAAPPAQQLQQQAPPALCAPRGRVVPEPLTSSLIIYETQSNIDSLVTYVLGFDQRPQQVNIKTQIVSINNTKTNRLGVSYDIGQNGTFFNTLAPHTVNGAPSTGSSQVTLGGDAFAGVANAQRNFSGNTAINLLFNTTIGGFNLTTFLDALQSEELSNTSSAPSVNTLDKVSATLFVGNTQAFLLTPQTAPGAIQAAAPQIQQIQAGITLTVTPSISANRTIRLKVVAEQSAITSINIAGPATSRRNYNGEVIVRDGETAVISGLSQETVTRNRRGIPLLSSLPGIGRLFSENESIIIKDDLLILITPHILDDVIPGVGGAK